MKSLNNAIIAILIVSMVISSCSKDKKEDTPPEVVQLKIQEKLDEIDVPANLQNSQTIYALQVTLYISQIKAIAGYFGFFDPIDGAEYNDGTYFWSYGGQSVWMTYTENSDAYVYQMDVDFGTGRVNYITSQQDKDGSSGWLRVFDYTNSTSNDFIYEYAWEINNDGSVVLTQTTFDDDFQLEISGSPDDSGYTKVYEDGKLHYEFVWNSDGSGYYKEYDDSGSEIDSETWTVDDL